MLETRLGTLWIEEDGKGICAVSFSEQKSAEAKEQDTPLLLEAAKQLKEYFGGARREFELPLSLRGTEFQRRVWNCLLQIPYGETRSYGEIAAMAGNPRACRAVGMANHQNPVAVIVPCHRVIGADGKLTGYAGGLHLKEALLLLEKIHKQ